MNTRKGLVVGIAAAVAASAAVSVSAVELGSSAETVDFAVIAGEETVINTTVETETGTANINVKIPADALAEGEYSFAAAPVVDADFESAFVASLGDGVTVDYFEGYSFSFTDATGAYVSPEGVVITIATGASFNAAYIEEADKSFTYLGEPTVIPGGYQITAPHCSRFVFANLKPIVPNSEPIDEPSPETSPEIAPQPQPQPQPQPKPQPKPDDKGANTGDSSATVAVVGVMGLAALGTALVAAKSKKASK